LPETVHRVHAVAGSPWAALRELGHRTGLRTLFAIDFLYWMCFAVYQGTFALFGERRFGFNVTQIGYTLAAFGVLGVLVQGVLVGKVVAAIGERKTLTIGLVCAAFSWGASAFAHSIPLFMLLLIPGAIGIGFCNPSLSSLLSGAAGRHEQGRVQGAAGALESLGRTIGPMWGNGALQWFGEWSAYASAAVVLLMTAGLSLRYRPRPPDAN
jgi:DHA1 family tetracycline resistance protein-like MFS transporter